MTTDAQEPPPEHGLTALQLTVAQAFFALPESSGFLLAGGGALLAQQLTARPTQDLDFFTSTGGSTVPEARDAIERAAFDRGWTVTRIRDEPTFARLTVHADEDLIVDLALDSPPQHAPTASIAGPTFDPVELAGRKTIALFDRAEARDFVDVHALARRFGKQRLLDEAAALDPGFTPATYAQALSTISRHPDPLLETGGAPAGELRRFFDDWRSELESHP